MNLELATRRVGEHVVVAATGEIDNVSAPALREALVAALDEGAPQVVVDLTGVEFLDSSGLGALVGVNKHAQRTSARVAVVCPQPHLRRLFEISRLDEVLQVFDSLDAVTAP